MRLKDFPLLRKGMYEVMMDQYRSGMRLLPEKEISDYWEPRFKIAEEGLQLFVGKLIKDVCPLLHEMPGYEDVDPSGDAFYGFVLPQDDMDAWLATGVGMSPIQYAYAKDILEQFFDGPLRGVFQEFKRDQE